MIRFWKILVLFPVLTLVGGSTRQADADFAVNGSFEQNTGTGQFGVNNGSAVVSATGWTSTGYNVLYAPGTADTVGAYTQYNNYIKLWGPNNGSANGLPTTSPDGGYFVASDGNFNTGPISQTINGLTIGKTYTVAFWWAGAQQQGYTGATTEQWQVSFGGTTKSTAVVNNVSHGFTGWMRQTFDFKADATSDVLSFLAVGTPSGLPPFSLLDGVSVNVAVPEPSTLVLMGIGLAGVGGIKLRQRLRLRASRS